MEKREPRANWSRKIEMDILTEPGFLAVVLLIAAAVNGAIGAALARPMFAEFNRRARELLDDANVADSDHRGETRKRVSNLARFATSKVTYFGIFLMAPFFAVKLASSAHEVVRAANRQAAVHAVLQRGKSKPDDLQSAAFAAVFRSSPLVTAWVLLWMAPAIVLLMVIAKLPAKRFRVLSAQSRQYLADDYAHSRHIYS